MMTFWFIISYFWWIFLIKFIVEFTIDLIRKRTISWNGTDWVPKDPILAKEWVMSYSDEGAHDGFCCFLYDWGIRHVLVMQVNGSCLVVPHVPPCPQFALYVGPHFFEKAQFSHLIGGDHRSLTCLFCFYQIWQRPYLPHLLYYIRCSFHYQLPPKFSLSN